MTQYRRGELSMSMASPSPSYKQDAFLDEEFRRALKQVLAQQDQIKELTTKLDCLIEREVEYGRMRVLLAEIYTGLRLIVQSVDNGHHEVYREQIRDLARVLAGKLEEVVASE